MTIGNLQRAVRGVAAALKRRGIFAFSVAHPCFWNLYRKDEPFGSFDYWSAHAVTAPFRITLDRKPLPKVTTYFHRPLSEYVAVIRKCGFELTSIVEPAPPSSAPPSYRERYTFPRFIIFSCIAVTI
jgi:hypothetical protein